ncbi:unnamed protein product [Didymodactylos carnosus]|uniref:Sugar phosphate transporter domain-containing protein n=1 Tax=Didymodactylos carnosus TaxID=1234261 RepID=A0A815THM2_9BILA|nr:unnamed protein product [Didymodactylos carnosus]CAF4367787.1 unnamed protein product [Didymodactylos carnosus]
MLRNFTLKSVSIIKILPIAISYSTANVFTNFSLQYNTVGTHQLFKVLTTPTVAILTWYYYNQKYSRIILLTLVPVIIGVCIHSLSDMTLNGIGVLTASIGVLSGSMFQIWIGERQRELELNSQQLLFYQAPVSAIVLIPFVLLNEKIPSYLTFQQHHQLIVIIAISGSIAFSNILSAYCKQKEDYSDKLAATDLKMYKIHYHFLNLLLIIIFQIIIQRL